MLPCPTRAPLHAQARPCPSTVSLCSRFLEPVGKGCIMCGQGVVPVPPATPPYPDREEGRAPLT